MKCTYIESGSSCFLRDYEPSCGPSSCGYDFYFYVQVLHMWDWASSDLLSKVTLDTAAISGVAFHPFDNNLVITHGRAHLAFWNRFISTQ